MTSYFISGCEARAINLGNKNVKIGIFTCGTSVRSKSISRYPTGKHEINNFIWCLQKQKKRNVENVRKRKKENLAKEYTIR